MNRGVVIDNLSKIAAGIDAAKALVTPALLDKVEQNLPKVRALVTPGPDGKTTLDQVQGWISAAESHPRLVDLLVSILM